jgi:hypothetical protein
MKLILLIKGRNKNLMKNPIINFSLFFDNNCFETLCSVVDMKFGKWLLVVINFFLHSMDILNYFFLIWVKMATKYEYMKLITL